ncbi:type II secretion system F family protein [Neomicrococcus lactis]|uniref:type II secretion system F family protein n=1 Tax=Neomicrococcus lactis TaxID=732241 RepID=UPI0023014591|nr:hypothetical protein [Neomicrococcus lactis]
MLWLIAALVAVSVFVWLQPAPSPSSYEKPELRRRQLADSRSPSFPALSRFTTVRLPFAPSSTDTWVVQEELAQGVRKIAALLRAGVPPVRAWELLAHHETLRARQEPHHEDSSTDGASATFADVAHRVSAAMRLGLEPDRPLKRASQQPQDLWARLSWCVSLSKETGTPLSTLFERVAADESARADRGRALESVLAGPKMTQKLLGWLPAGGVLMAQLLGAQPLSLLFGSVVGQALLVGGCTLWWINLWWSKKLLEKVTTCSSN